MLGHALGASREAVSDLLPPGGGYGSPERSGMMFKAVAFEEARKQKAKNLKKLLATKNVVGVGIGAKLRRGRPTGELSVRVYVERKIPKSELGSEDLLPFALGEMPVDVVEVGRPIPYKYETRRRPAIGGDSIGHVNVSAGTLGCLMRDKTDGSVVILSNNHILADADGVAHPAAAVGDCIVQPGVADEGTCAADQIAVLKRWVQLIEVGSGTNDVDAAIASPLNTSDVQDTIHEIGCVSEWREVAESDVMSDPADPDNVQKAGRTTEYTTGKITDIDATVTISYGAFSATHDDVIVTTNMAAPGDSGSLLVDMDKKAVGLLFGGSPGAVVYYSRIGKVLDALDVEFLPCFDVCLIGPRPPCVVGGPSYDCQTGGPIHCLLGGPDSSGHCEIGGPDRPIYCRIGGPDNPIQCSLGGPTTPVRCSLGGPGRACRAGGPILECGAGPHFCGAGPEFGCIAGPGDIGVLDPEELVKIKGDIVISVDRLTPELRQVVIELIRKLRQY